MEGHAGNQASSRLDAHQFTTGDTKLVRGDGDLKDPDELGKQLCSGLNEQVGVESDPISFLIQIPHTLSARRWKRWIRNVSG